jgi:Tfp pilus assembly protein FimT
MKKILILLLVSMILQGCEFFRKLDKSSSNTASVKKEETNLQSGDTSKTKTNSTNEWERWVFAPKDTNITNIYLPKQETPRPIIYERGSGTQSAQIDLGAFRNMQQAFLDSVKATQSTKQTETKASLFSPMVILALGLLVFFILVFAVLIYIIFSKLKNKMTL